MLLGLDDGPPERGTRRLAVVIGKGFTDRYLTDDEAREVVREGLGTLSVDGKRVLVIIPDGTRTMPMPLMFTLFDELLAPRVAALDYLVALGTHPPMADAQLRKLVGRTVVDGQAGKCHIYNHAWEDPATFAHVGTIPAAEISQITGGLMSQDVPVELNRLILDYDQLVICGPVFPHEVVGFSGGTKYLFPGIGGPEIINFTHWLGAVITNYAVIGSGYTPVRAVIDRGAAFIDRPMACFALVVTHEGLAGLYVGTPEEAWQAASALSAKKHIVYVDRPFRRVLSVMPELYDDLWTGAKGMYKMEPAVADGGEVVIYAPHITEVSYTHGKLIDEIGYHCRDYFLKQWERFKEYPGGVLAHSTHVKGLGAYDAATGIETPRISVTLATGIPRERCRRINLGYLDPKTVDLRAWRGREDEGVLVVPRAGEMLYRVKAGGPGDKNPPSSR
jgi:nickel-dependent lactate racemase